MAWYADNSTKDIQIYGSTDIPIDWEVNNTSSLIKINELQEINNYGFNTFDDTTNLTDLYRDSRSGDLFFTTAGKQTNRTFRL